MSTTVTTPLHALYCILSVLRDAPRADRRILWGVQLDSHDVAALREILSEGWPTGSGESSLSDMGYALCTAGDAVANGHVDVRYVGGFASITDDRPLHGVYGSKWQGHSVPLPVHETTCHAGDEYVSLPGDTFAGEPLRSGTLVGWDATCSTHYPMGPAPASLYGSLYGVGSLVHVLHGTGLYRVVEGYAPEDRTVAIVPVAQGIRGPVTRAPIVNVRPHVVPIGTTFGPCDDIELGETITDLVGDADHVGGLSLWDIMRAVGQDVDAAIGALCDAEVLRIVRYSPSHGATLYGTGPAR